MLSPVALNELGILFIDLSSRPLALLKPALRERLLTELDAFTRCAALLKIPKIVLSFPSGGTDAPPLASIPVEHRLPHTTNNSFETPNVKDTVATIGRRTLALAGIATDVGVTFTALGALRLGYRVLVIVDLCGSTSPIADQAAWSRLSQAGATLVTWQALIGEVQADYTIGIGLELIATISAAALKTSVGETEGANVNTQLSTKEQLGLRKLREIAGDNASRPLEDWNKVAPDMTSYIVEFIAGDILSRPGLDPKSRQLVTVAILATLGTAPDEFRMHLQGALNLGWTKKEISEALIQLAPFAGFPAALVALSLARDIL